MFDGGESSQTIIQDNHYVSSSRPIPQVFAIVSRTTLPTPPVTPPSTGFSDVSSDDWFAEAVNFMADRGYMTGNPDGTFGPANPLSRAEAAVIFKRVLDDLNL